MVKRAFFLVLTFLAVSAAAHANVLRVPSQYPFIQDAVNAAQPGDSVVVAPGLYDDLRSTPLPDTTRTVVFMAPGITLLGAGPGETIIDALGGGRGIHCHQVTGIRIEGFTIRDAFAENYGAGIFATQNSELTVINCEITQGGDGGVICTFGTDIVMEQCQVTDNGSKQGGGIAIETDSSCQMTDCTVTGNFAPAGGGVFIRASSGTIERSVISDNFLDTIQGSGGGLEIRESQVTIRDSQINDNVSTGPGGGIAIRDFAEVMIERSVVHADSTTDDDAPGAGIYLELSSLALDKCEITRNVATGTVSDGGGMYIWLAQTVTISSCTVAANSANSAGGGGVTCVDSSPTIGRTILAFNAPGKGIYCSSAGSEPVISCCDVFGNAGGDEICGIDAGGNFSQDPLFCDLPADDFTLQVASPCLDNQHPQGAPCDGIGAYGFGPCNGIGIAEEDPAGRAVPPIRHYASPNPFGFTTAIHYGLGSSRPVWLAIYDMSGRRVKLLEDRVAAAGLHQATWDGTDDAGRLVPSGVYVYRFGGGVPVTSGRLVLAR